MTADMLAWTRQQIETRKALAESASPWPWSANAEHDEVLAVDGERVADGFALSGNQLRNTVDHIVWNDPLKIIADCEADLTILDLHEIAEVSAYERLCAGEKGQPFGCRLCHEHDGITVGWGICDTLRAVASRYRHRPGYLPEWAPEGATP
ncbi:DUF6221 family protein [Nonomuraea wenchangensis]|uniref:DUF6221 family protein n=1 Tax=Nonomuraea wenchangensis TaxID=568860 RepID=UPI0033299AD1